MKFREGDRVVCIRAEGYPNLTNGHVYDVVQFDDINPTEYYTFPAYITVYGDNNKRNKGHASRFELVKDMSQAIKLTTPEVKYEALVNCDAINNDNEAVVMVKGYDDDYDNFTAIYLIDYEGYTKQEIIDIIDEYPECQLWVYADDEETTNLLSTTNQEDTMTNKTETKFKPLTQVQIKHALKRLEELWSKSGQVIRDSRVVENKLKLGSEDRVRLLNQGKFKIKQDVDFINLYTRLNDVIDFGDDDVELFTRDELNVKLKVLNDLHTEAKDKVIFAGSEEALQVLSSMTKTFEETVANLLPNKVA